MTASTPPDKRMAMLVPIGGRVADRLTDVGPGLKSPSFQGQGAENLPPRFDQVQVGRTLGLEDEFPPLMREREQQDVQRPMDIQVIDNPVNSLDLRRKPSIDLLQEVDPVGNRSATIRFRQRGTRGRLEGTEAVAFAPPSVVDLLRCPFGRSRTGRIRQRPDEFLTTEAFGRFRSHLIHTNDYASVWR